MYGTLRVLHEILFVCVSDKKNLTKNLRTRSTHCSEVGSKYVFLHGLRTPRVSTFGRWVYQNDHSVFTFVPTVLHMTTLVISLVIFTPYIFFPWRPLRENVFSLEHDRSFFLNIVTSVNHSNYFPLW